MHMNTVVLCEYVYKLNDIKIMYKRRGFQPSGMAINFHTFCAHLG